jgi:hypothetical protein
MNTRAKLFVLAFSGLSIVAMSSLKASARIVCDTDVARPRRLCLSAGRSR